MLSLPSIISYHKALNSPLSSFHRHPIVQVHWKILKVEILKQKYNLEFVDQKLIQIIYFF